MAVMAFPTTVYAVSPLYFDKATGTRFRQTNWLFAVSGDDPLADDEAKARGRKMAEDAWDAAGGESLDKWQYNGAAMSRVLLTR